MGLRRDGCDDFPNATQYLFVVIEVLHLKKEIKIDDMAPLDCLKIMVKIELKNYRLLHMK